MKDPVKVAAGKAGAAARWGVPRRLQLGDLTPDQRRLVLALVEAQRAVNAGADTSDDRPRQPR